MVHGYLRLWNPACWCRRASLLLSVKSPCLFFSLTSPFSLLYHDSWSSSCTAWTMLRKSSIINPAFTSTSKLIFGCLKMRQKSTGVMSKNTQFVKRKIPLPVTEICRSKDKQWQTRQKLGEPAVLVSAACRAGMLRNPLVTALWKTCSSANVTHRHLFKNSSFCL